MGEAGPCLIVGGQSSDEHWCDSDSETSDDDHDMSETDAENSALSGMTFYQRAEYLYERHAKTRKS